MKGAFLLAILLSGCGLFPTGPNLARNAADGDADLCVNWPLSGLPLAVRAAPFYPALIAFVAAYPGASYCARIYHDTLGRRVAYLTIFPPPFPRPSY